jgi:hypothetical protein
MKAGFRRMAFGLWIVAAFVEVVLLSRFICMWIFGVNATGGSSSAIVTDLYRLTTPLINPLAKSANVYLPPAGLGHVFDVTCFLAMDVVFFGVLGITKLGIWAGARSDERRERKASAANEVAHTVEPEIPPARVPVKTTAR